MSQRRAPPLAAFAWLAEGPAAPSPAALREAISVGDKASSAAQKAADEVLLMLAVEQAQRGVGRTGPNPPVGAVVVKGGEVIGRGFHKKAGQPHAEVEAFNDAGPGKSEGATLYVTLEPCNQQGRTGPCTERTIAEGVRRVVVGVTDPNPQVNGKGIRRLKRAGIDVAVMKTGPAAHACQALIAPFASVHQRGRPWVVAKVAATLDGKVATRTGHASWVTGSASRKLVHQLRDRCDAILVGAGTARADDPSLTVREAVGRKKLNPRRVLVDGKLSVPASAKLFGAHPADRAPPVVLSGSRASAAKRADLERAGVVVERFSKARVDLEEALVRLAGQDVLSVLVEPGPALLSALVEAELIDELWWMTAPTLLGADGKSAFGRRGAQVMQDAFDLPVARAPSPVGDDVLLITGRPAPRSA